MSKRSRRRKRRRKRRSSEQKSPRHSSEKDIGRLAVLLALKLVQLAVAIASLLVVVKLLAGAPGYVYTTSAVAGALVLYDFFDVVNWRRIKYLRERQLWPLVTAYVAYLIALAGVAASATIVGGGWLEGALVVLAFVLAGFGRARVETRVCQQLRALRLSDGEARWGEGLRPRIERLLDRIASRRGDPDKHPGQVLMGELAASLRAALRGPLRSMRRLVALGVMVASLLLGGWSGLALGSKLIRAIAGSSPSTAAAPKKPAVEHHVHSETAAKEAAGQPSTSTASAPNPTPLSECAVPPGTGAPGWAKQDILHLYLGGRPLASEAPGTLIAGCPDRYQTVHTRDGEFLYTIGWDPSHTRRLSIAVDSRRFGPSLFLAPAVQPVLELIDHRNAVGGVRAFSVGAGQFYPVQSDRGTYILIRRATAGMPAVTRFTLIPPPVAQSWAAAVLRSGKFLWPMPGRHGLGSYDFLTGSAPPMVAYTFTYRPPGVPEPELSQSELTAIAATPE